MSGADGARLGSGLEHVTMSSCIDPLEETRAYAETNYFMISCDLWFVCRIAP